MFLLRLGGNFVCTSGVEMVRHYSYIIDSRQIIIGGKRQFKYEFYPKYGKAKNAYSLRLLA